MVSNLAVDWLEWQASYCAAELLMPKSRLELLVSAFTKTRGGPPFQSGAREAVSLEQRVTEAFEVSQQAAAVRLAQLGYVSVARSKGS